MVQIFYKRAEFTFCDISRVLHILDGFGFGQSQDYKKAYKEGGADYQGDGLIAVMIRPYMRNGNKLLYNDIEDICIEVVGKRKVKGNSKERRIIERIGRVLKPEIIEDGVGRRYESMEDLLIKITE